MEITYEGFNEGFPEGFPFIEESEFYKNNILNTNHTKKFPKMKLFPKNQTVQFFNS